MSDLQGALPSSPSSSVIHTTMVEAMKSTMEDLFNIQPNPYAFSSHFSMTLGCSVVKPSAWFPHPGNQEAG
jgi:hypothetical protein